MAIASQAIVVGISSIAIAIASQAIVVGISVSLGLPLASGAIEGAGEAGGSHSRPVVGAGHPGDRGGPHNQGGGQGVEGVSLGLGLSLSLPLAPDAIEGPGEAREGVAWPVGVGIVEGRVAIASIAIAIAAIEGICVSICQGHGGQTQANQNLVHDAMMTTHWSS